MITALVLSSLAAIWGWFVLNDPNSPRFIVWTARQLRKLPKGDKLVGCPWCGGAWLNILATTLLHWRLDLLDWAATPVACFAAAGLTGLIATLMPDNGEPTDD